MKEIYFIDDQHYSNYKKLLLKWPIARKGDPEYQVSCYIMALPLIFTKVGEQLDVFDSPIDWIWNWEWYYKLSNLEEFSDSKEEQTEPTYDLTPSMVQLGRLSLNLFNGYEHFNLMSCLSSVDDKHYKVVKCALDIRSGVYKHKN